MTNRTLYSAAAALTGSVFLLYLATLSPAVAMWDAGEYIAAASALGVPHQPGNPLYVLIAHVAGLLPLSGAYAVRINLLAAFASATAAGLWFLCAERLLRSTIAGHAHRLVAAAAAALFGATAFTVWNQSVVMEKVYPLALVGLSLTSWLVVRWLDTEPGKRADRLLVLVAYITGLTYAIHPAGLLTGPAAALAVLRHRPSTIRRWKLLAVFGVAFVAGASPFAMLPIRAAHEPYVNVSAISACEGGAIAAGCTFSAETARRLTGTIRREQYGGNAVFERRGPIGAQLGMYWLYFKWQWLRDVRGTMPFAQTAAALTMLLLGIAGLRALRGERAGGERTGGSQAHDAYRWYFGALALTFTLALIYYLNFRYGWSQRPDLGGSVPREPRDRDYFFMWTFSLWGLLAGVGLASVTRALRPRVAMLALAAAVLVPVGANWKAAARTGQSFTTEWAKDLLMSLEPNAIMITHGDNDSFPLWYAQQVEGIRRDVTVTLTPYLGLEWYARQLNRRANLWALSDEVLDSIPFQFQAETPLAFEHGEMRATIPPGILVRDQLLVLQAIKDSFPARPIYFSAGGYANTLGLDPYVKRVGLVNQLMPAPVTEGPDTVRVDGEWVDLPRTLDLWDRYGGARQLLREGRWIDSGSAVIPIYYAAMGQQLALALDARGRTNEAAEVMEVAQQVVEAVR